MIFHHIATDGWSEVPLLSDLGTAYTARHDGRAPAWRPLAVQYADYALWQRTLLAEESDVLAAYWRAALQGVPECLHLPVDRPRPPVAGTDGAGEPITIGPELHGALLHVARTNRVTLFMVLQAAWATLLTRLGAGTDIPIGVPVAGRPHESLGDLVGFFVNTLVLRTDTSGNPGFDELLARIRSVDLDGYQHEEMPFEQVVQAVNPRRTQASHPLFETMLILQNTGEAEMSLPGLTVRREPFTTGVAKFDLVVDVGPADPGGLQGSLDYRTGLFDRSTARSLVAGFLGVLAEIAADPSAPVDPAPTVLDLVAEQVRSRPGAAAVVSPGRELSYQELDERSNAVAWELRNRGVGAGTAVAVGVERSADLCVAMLAVFKAGGVYVPLDPDYPAPRLRLMVEDAAPPVIVTNRHLADRVPDGPVPLFLEEHTAARRDRPPEPAGPDDLAYVIYTSGSSGRPKGVAVGHAALGRHTRAMVRVFGYTATDRTLVFASVAFDMSVEQIITPLACGAAAVIRPDGMLGTRDLIHYADQHTVTVVNVPPAYLEALLREGAGLGSVRLFVSGGDTVTPGIVRAAHDAAGRRRVLNAYGPTETTITATVQDLAEVVEGGPVPIGRPIPGARVHVLTGTGAPAGQGEIGEIVIGGDGVARGYLNQPALTAQRFVEDEAGRRFYRTGDLGRHLPGGALEFLGRADDQVKVNGFRIEPAEVEAALAKLPGVTGAVVVADRDEAGGGRLFGYATTVTGADDGLRLRRDLLEVLPRHMVPVAVTVLESFPLTLNGKVDRKALGGSVVVAQAGEGVVPSDPVTDLLAGIWAEVLRVPQVGPHDNFFALGGHSMLAIQLVSRVKAALGADVPLHQFFEAPTPADMAALAGARTRTAARSTPSASAGRDRGPLSSGQERLWLLQTLDPDSHEYNVASLWQLDGAVDVGALRDALTGLVRRHRILRTRFDMDEDGPCQIVVPAPPIPLDVHSTTFDRGQLPPEARSFAEEPFDLTTPPLLRARLFRDARRPRELVFLLVVHHIATDGAALETMLRELGADYRRQPVAEPDLQYLDYAIWERQQPPAQEHVAYWRDRLHGLRPMAWPAGHDRPAGRSGVGEVLEFDVPGDVVAGLRHLGRTADMSMFVMTLAAFGAALAEFTGRHDIAVGVPLTMRTQPQLIDLVGFLTDTLVVRSTIDPEQGLQEVLRSVRSGVLEGMAHAIPFDRVVEELNPEREVGRNPLFQVFFAHERTDAAAAWTLPEVTTTPIPWLARTAKFDLDLGCTESADGMTFTLTYATSLLGAADAHRLADQYAATLRSVAALSRLTPGPAGLSA
jgi:amino acid adenylation domain-containing protein